MAIKYKEKDYFLNGHISNCNFYYIKQFLKMIIIKLNSIKNNFKRAMPKISHFWVLIEQLNPSTYYIPLES